MDPKRRRLEDGSYDSLISSTTLSQINQLIPDVQRQFEGVTVSGSHRHVHSSGQIENLIVSQVQGDQTVHGDINVSTIVSPTINIATPPQPTRITKFCLIDSPSPNFSGRQELLKEIHSKLSACSTKSNFADRTVVLRGLGGIGKSELARTFAANHMDDPIIQNVTLINAETLASLKASFASLADTFGLPTENKEVKEIVRNVYAYFSDHIGTGLFIFDNAQQMNDRTFGLYKYLPTQQLKRRPLVLITTRDKDWEIPKESIISINELSTGEAAEFLTKRLQLTTHQQNDGKCQKAVLNLARTLQGYPLALALAAANISNDDWTDLDEEIESYISRMNIPKGGWVQDEQSGSATNYELIMDDVWKTTFDRIKSSRDVGPNALNLVNLMAYRNTDGITMEHMWTMHKECFSKDCGKKAFGILEKYSIISIFQEFFKSGELRGTRIRIHRLVQRCTREMLDENNDFTFLLHVCRYESLHFATTYTQNTEFNSLHEFLKERDWPENSMVLSSIFSYMLIPKMHHPSNCAETALQIAEDVYERLHLGDDLSAKIDVSIAAVKLLALSVFWLNGFHDPDKYKVCRDPRLSHEKLLPLFVSLLKPCIQHFLTPNAQVKHEERCCHLFCFEILKDLLDCDLVDLLKEVMEIILATVRSAETCSLETIGKIYEALWNCCWCHVTFVGYMEEIFKKHFAVYPMLEADSNSKKDEQLKKYWELGKPLRLELFVALCQRASFEDETVKVQDSIDLFKAVDGLKILTHYITYLETKAWAGVDRNLFSFVHFIAYESDSPATLIESQEFLDAYWKLTRTLANKELTTVNEYLSERCDCLKSWFAMFARVFLPDEGDAQQHPRFSIHTVSTDLMLMVAQIERVGWVKYPGFILDACTDVLKTFLETYKEAPDCEAVQAARRLTNLFLENA